MIKKRPYPRVSKKFHGKSLTKQSMTDECNINLIMKRIMKGEHINHVNSAQPLYEHAPEVTDYAESLQIIKDAEAAFAALPSRIRADFKNEPEEFLKFANDPQHDQEMIDMGLRKRKPPEKPPVPPTPEPIPSTAIKTEFGD